LKNPSFQLVITSFDFGEMYILSGKLVGLIANFRVKQNAAKCSDFLSMSNKCVGLFVYWTCVYSCIHHPRRHHFFAQQLISKNMQYLVQIIRTCMNRTTVEL